MGNNKGAFGKPGALRPQKTAVRRQYFTFGGNPAEAVAQLNSVLTSIEDKLSVKITEYYTSNINELGQIQEALRFVISLPLNLPLREEKIEETKEGKVIPITTTKPEPAIEQSEENGEMGIEREKEEEEEAPQPGA